MGSTLPNESRRGHRGAALERSRPRRSSDAGVVLAAFIARQGLTQAQLADLLGVDRTLISRVLSGSRQIRDVDRLRQVARTIGVPPERFGLLPELKETALPAERSHVMPRDVREDVDAWRKVRIALNHRRPQLTKAAESVYDGVARILGTPMITFPGWMPF
jgi:transcriptional regulator with XRE-family HTH domain